MIVGMSRACCGVGMVTISTKAILPRSVVVHGKPLVFNLQLGINAIKPLGAITVGPMGSVKIGDGKVTMCPAISINEPDYTAIFDPS